MTTLLLPQHSCPPKRNYATLDLLHSQLVIDFDAAAAESTEFYALSDPALYGEPAAVKLFWCRTGGPEVLDERAVAWSVRVNRCKAVVVTGQAERERDVVTMTLVPIGRLRRLPLIERMRSWAWWRGEGEPLEVEITRRADQLRDTMCGDASLLSVEVGALATTSGSR